MTKWATIGPQKKSTARGSAEQYKSESSTEISFETAERPKCQNYKILPGSGIKIYYAAKDKLHSLEFLQKNKTKSNTFRFIMPSVSV